MEESIVCVGAERRDRLRDGARGQRRAETRDEPGDEGVREHLSCFRDEASADTRLAVGADEDALERDVERVPALPHAGERFGADVRTLGGEVAVAAAEDEAIPDIGAEAVRELRVVEDSQQDRMGVVLGLAAGRRIEPAEQDRAHEGGRGQVRFRGTRCTGGGCRARRCVPCGRAARAAGRRPPTRQRALPCIGKHDLEDPRRLCERRRESSWRHSSWHPGQRRNQCRGRRARRRNRRELGRPGRSLCGGRRRKRCDGRLALGALLPLEALLVAFAPDALQVVGHLRELAPDLLDRGALEAAPCVARIDAPAGRRDGHRARALPGRKEAGRLAVLVEERTDEGNGKHAGEQAAREQDLPSAHGEVRTPDARGHSVASRSRTMYTGVDSPGPSSSCSTATPSTPDL